jgi:hypothetical protein
MAVGVGLDTADGRVDSLATAAARTLLGVNP